MAYQNPRLIPLLFLVFFHVSSKIISADPTTTTQAPTPWPLQFHSILFTNYSGAQQLIDLWYDWPNGRNFNIIQNQLGKLLYDLEWNNGTTFYYTLDSSKECKSIQIQVGILRPNWLDGATYLGQHNIDGFPCNVWEKEDFIGYYEDVVTKRPVYWEYYSGLDAGRSFHVMTFEVGAVLEDAKWQAPVYCFDKKGAANTPKLEYKENGVPQKSILKRSCEGVQCPFELREVVFT